MLWFKHTVLLWRYITPTLLYLLQHRHSMAANEWRPLLMLRESQSLQSTKNRLLHGLSSPDAAAASAALKPVSEGTVELLSEDSNTPWARINWASIQPNILCQNRSIQSEKGRGQGRKKGESRRMCSNGSCVPLGLQAGTQPGSDKGMAFLHILPCSGWHSSSVIGYLKGRSCFVRNDFLSVSMNYAACQFVRYLTEKHKGFMHF